MTKPKKKEKLERGTGFFCQSCTKTSTEVKAEFDDSVWDVYASACGINLNATVTNDHIYVPIFASQYDERAIEIISAHTDKMVHGVNARGVCFMGGSVRCLSWQVCGLLD